MKQGYQLMQAGGVWGKETTKEVCVNMNFVLKWAPVRGRKEKRTGSPMAGEITTI